MVPGSNPPADSFSFYFLLLKNSESGGDELGKMGRRFGKVGRRLRIIHAPRRDRDLVN